MFVIFFFLTIIGIILAKSDLCSPQLLQSANGDFSALESQAVLLRLSYRGDDWVWVNIKENIGG